MNDHEPTPRIGWQGHRAPSYLNTREIDHACRHWLERRGLKTELELRAIATAKHRRLRK